MTVSEVCALFGKSRRQIGRYVEQGKIPPPSREEPMSWEAKVIMAAYRQWREKENGDATTDFFKPIGP